MNNFEIFFYFVCFFTKFVNIQSINVEMFKPKPRHPDYGELPSEFGEEVMYVDLTKEKLDVEEDEN